MVLMVYLQERWLIICTIGILVHHIHKIGDKLVYEIGLNFSIMAVSKDMPVHPL